MSLMDSMTINLHFIHGQYFYEPCSAILISNGFNQIMHLNPLVIRAQLHLSSNTL